jgi:Sec-independent protein translocase protein TatA
MLPCLECFGLPELLIVLVIVLVLRLGAPVRSPAKWVVNQAFKTGLQGDETGGKREERINAKRRNNPNKVPSLVSWLSRIVDI